MSMGEFGFLNARFLTGSIAPEATEAKTSDARGGDLLSPEPMPGDEGTSAHAHGQAVPLALAFAFLSQ